MIIVRAPTGSMIYKISPKVEKPKVREYKPLASSFEFVEKEVMMPSQSPKNGDKSSD